MKKKILVMVVFCAFAASQATADLFNFSYDVLQTSYDDAGNFSAGVIPGLTVGTVTRLQDPLEKVVFTAFGSPESLADFQINMTVSNIDTTPGYADSSGTFLLMDKEGNVLSGNIDGTWTNANPASPIPSFRGALSEILFTDVGIIDNTLKGDWGEMSMEFSTAGPWEGLLIQLTTSGLWFDMTWQDVNGGGVNASVVPVPGTALLALLGLGTAGMRLRRRDV